MCDCLCVWLFGGVFDLLARLYVWVLVCLFCWLAGWLVGSLAGWLVAVCVWLLCLSVRVCGWLVCACGRFCVCLFAWLSVGLLV